MLHSREANHPLSTELFSQLSAQRPPRCLKPPKSSACSLPMKLHGQPVPVQTHTTTVVLQRPNGETLSLKLRPLPLGFHRRLRERGLNSPAPPTRVGRDAQGRPLRDQHGLAISISDPHNPEYVCQLEQYHQRVAVLSIAEALSADPDLQLETPIPATTASSADWTAYADAVAAELESAGFTAGDLIRICDAICRLSNLIDDHIVGETANFSSASSPGSS